MIRRTFTALVAVLLFGSASAHAQDSSLIRLGLQYGGSARPGLMVLSGPGLDSVRAIIDRDLQRSDRFEMPIPDSLSRLSGAFDPKPFAGARISFVVELQPAGSDVEVKLYDMATGTVRQQGRYPVDRAGVGEGRLPIHVISDSVVRWTTGGIGIAATRILYLQDDPRDKGLYRIDYDGQNRVRIPTSGSVISPTWSPRGTHIAYAELRESIYEIIIRTMATGNRVTLNKLYEHRNDSYFDPAFAPDMQEMVFVRSGESGYGDIYRADISSLSGSSQTQPLTVDRKLAINVKPAYSPDGRSIAYERTLSRSPNQIYRMDADGTDPAPLVMNDGSGGKLHAPSWSPDGLKIAFEREDAQGQPQIFTMDVASGRTRQHTSDGRNESPAWGPDSRHLLFRSNRSGKVRLWILDTESANKWTIETPGGAARYPAWSPSIIP